MDKKIIIHTDASNIKNSNVCKMSSIIEYEDKTTTTVDYFAGKINQAELIAVLKTLEQVEEVYQPVNFVIELYTDHLPNAKLLKTIILAINKNSQEDIDKINRILIRKDLTWPDINVVSRLHTHNELDILWIPRKENKTADKLSKGP